MSIATQLIHMAADESIPAANDTAAKFQSALESMCEVGSDTERKAASFLLSSVNEAFHQINETNAVTIARGGSRQ